MSKVLNLGVPQEFFKRVMNSRNHVNVRLRVCMVKFETVIAKCRELRSQLSTNLVQVVLVPRFPEVVEVGVPEVPV